MDIRKLKTILDLFENSNLSEIEFCEGEERIRLTKATVAAPIAAPAAVTAAPPVAAVAAPAPDTGNLAASPPAAEEEAETGTPVNSPMVGTFYRSSSPDKSPFVSVGSTVKKGDTLCIVEAMKLMNEIPSPMSGVVKKIIPDNGEPVGYGAPLFIIE